ncbi:MAG: sodium:solute symporter [Bacillota bacterium]
MQSLDWVTIGLYFGALLAVTWWTLLKPKTSATGYFLAGKDVGWFAIGCSLFASNIGSEHLVGLAGAGAKSGVAMAHYELHAWCLLVLGWVMVPFYERSMVFTMPEFLERRYTPAARWFLSVISLVAYVFTKIAVGLAAGGVVFKALFPDNFIANVDNFWVGAIGVVLVTGVYTVLGGLRAVVYTEVIQTLVFIIGSMLLLVVGLWKLGGWNVLRETCGSEHFNLWKPLDHPSFPWLGMLVSAPIVGLWYWTTDQYIVQRTLAARNQTEARRGTIFASYLKLLPLWIFIVPGMIAFALATKGMLGSSSAALLKDPDQAFPIMVKEILPVGIRGLVAGGLLAALMSSLASCFNSSATLFTMDIYKKLYPHASEQTLVWVGRVATVVMVALGLMWIPLMGRAKGLYVYLQSVQTYLAPPIFAVFFLGVFFKRINGKGCMVGLVGGFLLGMARLTLEIMKERGVLAQGTVLYQVAAFNYLYLGIVLFIIAVVAIVVTSLLTAPPREEQLVGLTYSTVTAAQRAETRASWNKWDVITTAGVLALILVMYAYFNG